MTASFGHDLPVSVSLEYIGVLSAGIPGRGKSK